MNYKEEANLIDTLPPIPLEPKLYDFLNFAKEKHQERMNITDKKSSPEGEEELYFYNKLIRLSCFFDLVEKNVPALKQANNWKDDKSTHSYFNFLGKQSDENFYSDHIAALFDKNHVGNFANILFNQIGSRLSDWSEDQPQKVFREYLLSKWDPASPEGKRRVDVVVVGDKNVFIIENKTYSHEHDNQTKIYRDHAIKFFNDSKECRGIFLTPLGHAASDTNYHRYSYLDLISDIYTALDKTPETNPNYVLINHIACELKENIGSPLKKYIEKAKDYRRKHGA